MNGIASKLAHNFRDLYAADNHYILVPHKSIAKNLFKLYGILFIMYLLSANTLMTAIIFPVYFLMAYIFYYFYKILNNHGYKFFPFLIVSLVLNVPVLLLAYYMRMILGVLFEKGVFVWISAIFQ